MSDAVSFDIIISINLELELLICVCKLNWFRLDHTC